MSGDPWAGPLLLQLVLIFLSACYAAAEVALLSLNGFPEASAVSATLICRLATLWFAVGLGALSLGRRRA